MILVNSYLKLWNSFWILKFTSKTQKEIALFHPVHKSVWFPAVLLNVCIIVVTKYKGVFPIFNHWF